MISNSITNDSVRGEGQHAHECLAHEVRNLLNVAILSFDVLKATGAGVAGDKGQVLRRSLSDLRTLINRSLSDIRTTHGRDAHGALGVGEFINEIEAAATLEAQAKGIRLVVPPVTDDLVVEADRHELGAAVRNLLQNAFKFTKPGTTVDLRVRHSADRVRIEVQDECGGLPGGGLGRSIPAIPATRPVPVRAWPGPRLQPEGRPGEPRHHLGTKYPGTWVRVFHRFAALSRPGCPCDHPFYPPSGAIAAARSTAHRRGVQIRSPA